MSQKKIKLSPSKIESLKTCSWSFYCQYILKLPDFGNDGSKRGTICHNVLECLAHPRHKSKLEFIKKVRDPFQQPHVARYIRIMARSLEIDLDEKAVNKDKTGFDIHGEMIRDMIMVGIDFDFEDDDDAEEVITELEKIIEVDDPTKKYFIKGIIDKIKVFQKGETLVITDYKTSKSKFDKKKISENIQALTYPFFCRKIFPKAKKIIFKFLFLRFPKDPWVEVQTLNDDQIEGFEFYLSYLYDYINKFDEEKALQNMARHNGGHHLCGKNGVKKLKDGTETEEPNWKCPYKDGFDYWAVIDKNGNNVFSDVNKNKLDSIKLENGQQIVKKKYEGCPAWHSQNKDFKKEWSILS